jgi:hypothetical protein
MSSAAFRGFHPCVTLAVFTSRNKSARAMYLQKTEKARSELRPGVRTLGQRERTFLLLADGRKTLGDLRPMFEGQGEQIALNLIREGYLEQVGPQAASAPAGPARSLPAAAPAPVPAAAADPFEGKRSLATTRMFLFDICERMFTRRDPMMATILRDGLREAKDREAMLVVARRMVEEIERVAGSSRADSISERIAMLLPPENGPG